MYVHAVASMIPHLVSPKWNFLCLQNTDTTLSVLQFVTPAKYGSFDISYGAFAHKGQLVAVTVENVVEHVDTTPDPDTGYDVPAQKNYTWKGSTLDGEKAFEAYLTVRPEKLCDRIDVLGELPYFLRVIIQALVTKPFLYQWLDRVTARVTIEGEEPFEVTGTAFHECTFLN